MLSVFLEVYDTAEPDGGPDPCQAHRDEDLNVPDDRRCSTMDLDTVVDSTS